jgi:hypothetical protein
MTLSPTDSRDVHGFEAEPYELNGFCAVPGCNEQEFLERHHLWRRSAIGGDYWFVELPGMIVGNCVNLCRRHHRQVTDNEAAIRFHDDLFFWTDLMVEDRLLTWQPPLDFVSSTGETLGGRIESEHVHVENGAVCPTCHRRVPKPKIETEPEARKPRKVWSVMVPRDQWEDGADVLDMLIEGWREEFSKRGLQYGEAKSVKYFVLSTGLALGLTHIELVLGGSEDA